MNKKLKVYLRNMEGFFSETVDSYGSFANLVGDEAAADVVVINDFEPIDTDKIVACNSTGIDHIKSKKDVVSLRGLDLSDLTAVPELCLAMTIVLLRENGHEAKGKTLGVVGYGRIGKKFIEYADKIGLKTIWYDDALGLPGSKIERTPLNNLLKESDIVSLHIAADEENRGFFDKKKFEMMKKDAVFLNSARPWLVDTEALRWALDNKLSAAWVDFDVPFAHEKLAITPHIGGGTEESRLKTELMVAQRVREIYG